MTQKLSSALVVKLAVFGYQAPLSMPLIDKKRRVNPIIFKLLSPGFSIRRSAIFF
jgi:hypothetical protein